MQAWPHPHLSCHLRDTHLAQKADVRFWFTPIASFTHFLLLLLRTLDTPVWFLGLTGRTIAHMWWKFQPVCNLQRTLGGADGVSLPAASSRLESRIYFAAALVPRWAASAEPKSSSRTAEGLFPGCWSPIPRALLLFMCLSWKIIVFIGELSERWRLL